MWAWAQCVGDCRLFRKGRGNVAFRVLWHIINVVRLIYFRNYFVYYLTLLQCLLIPYDRSRQPWCEIYTARKHTCLNSHSEFRDAMVALTDYNLRGLCILLITTYLFHVVAMGNVLSYRCVPVGCFHVFVSRCLQMAPVWQSREHTAPRF